ncbi:hypothetical protein OH799_18565 [Nocardia sp. NBC_00881]|nr:hypothetical protein OH799_18565 [Nocardia sp. NBC_00881]
MRVSFVDEVSETVQLARTSRRFFDPLDRGQPSRTSTANWDAGHRFELVS